jgi:hypothetical protein
MANRRRRRRDSTLTLNRSCHSMFLVQALLRSLAKQANRTTINWHLVARDVPGRSQNKCYHRSINLTRAKVNNDFQVNDDQLLLEQHRMKRGELRTNNDMSQLTKTIRSMSIERISFDLTILGRWSEIQVLFPDRSCYTLQNRWRKLVQYRQINQLFLCQEVRSLVHGKCHANGLSLVSRTIDTSSTVSTQGQVGHIVVVRCCLRASISVNLRSTANVDVELFVRGILLRTKFRRCSSSDRHSTISQSTIEMYNHRTYQAIRFVDKTTKISTTTFTNMCICWFNGVLMFNIDMKTCRAIVRLFLSTCTRIQNTD